MNSESTAAIIEARYASTRLPGKVMMDICGKPLLKRLIDRIKLSKKITNIILATSTNSKDQQIENLAISENINFFRGSENDVLGRVIEAARKFKVETIISICGDCPLIDPWIIDKGLEIYEKRKNDLVCSGFKSQSYPQGTELVILDSDLLFEIDNKAKTPEFREHTCLYFSKNSENFKILDLVAENFNTMPSLRLQVDYIEDLKLVREIYKRLLPKFGNKFSIYDVINLIKKDYSLIRINEGCVEKKA